MGVLILGVNTLYRLFCFFKLFLMAGKGLLRTPSYVPNMLKYTHLTIQDKSSRYPVPLYMYSGTGLFYSFYSFLYFMISIFLLSIWILLCLICNMLN